MNSTLQWHHNGHDGIWNHQPHHCLLNRLFGRRSKKTSKLCVTGLCVGNSPGTCEFPAQMASKAENVSIWWCHHGNAFLQMMILNLRFSTIIDCLCHCILTKLSTTLAEKAHKSAVCIIRCRVLPKSFAHTWCHHQMETFSALLAICEGNSPHKGQWCGALMFSLIYTWTNGWVNNRDASDLRCHYTHYDVTVMYNMAMVDVNDMWVVRV